MDVRHGGCRQRLCRLRGHINVSSVVSLSSKDRGVMVFQHTVKIFNSSLSSSDQCFPLFPQPKSSGADVDADDAQTPEKPASPGCVRAEW